MSVAQALNGLVTETVTFRFIDDVLTPTGVYDKVPVSQYVHDAIVQEEIPAEFVEGEKKLMYEHVRLRVYLPFDVHNGTRQLQPGDEVIYRGRTFAVASYFYSLEGSYSRTITEVTVRK